VSDLLAGALSVLLSTNQPAALSNLVVQQTGVPLSATNDPVEVEFRAIVQADDKARDEVDQWVDEYDQVSGGKRPLPVELNRKIETNYDAIRHRYDDFILTHTNHAKVHLAYGSFLGEIGDVPGMETEWETARRIDPKDPAAWNNLAGFYAHDGPVEKAFPYFEKAIELNPKEPEYRHSLGTVVFLFRKDAAIYYHTNETGVFNKAFELYHSAMALSPGNFKLAADVAQTWYGVKPDRGDSEEARKLAQEKIVINGLRAWTNAYTIAPDDEDRQGVLLHYARWQMAAGRYNEARANLLAVTNETHLAMRDRLMHSLTNRETATSPETAK